MSTLPADRGPPNSVPSAVAGAQHPNLVGRIVGEEVVEIILPTPMIQRWDRTSSGFSPETSANRGRHRNRRPRQERPRAAGGESGQLPPHLATEAREIGGGRGNRNSNRGGTQTGRGGRRQHFGARLTEGSPKSAAPASEPAPPPPTSGDLTSRLIYSLTHKHDAVDCPICFNPVHPAQPIWSCAPPPTLIGDAPATCCWTIFHMKCIKEWARKSVEATREAYRARNVDLPGEWRCPGCQTKRTVIPQAYACFCARVTNPAPSQLSTPHSCGEPCARVRRECEHACPMACHPGPCPPCLCYCGKHEKEMPCGAGVSRECRVDGEGAWEGALLNTLTIDIGYSIAANTNAKNLVTLLRRLLPFVPSHPPSSRHALASKLPFRLSESLASILFLLALNRVAKFIRSADMPAPKSVIRAPVPHVRCLSPSSVDAERRLLKGCGRHVCNRVCCPLAGTAGKSKGKRKVDLGATGDTVDDDPEGWHTCDLICNKKLSCGNHNCMLPDHRGPCPSAIAEKVLCGMSGARKNARHAAPLAGSRLTVDIILATELAMLEPAGPVLRFAESLEKNVGILALFPVMHLPLVHQSMPYLAQRLAEALGISESGRSSNHNQVTWSPELVAFSRVPANQSFIKNMEKALADFVSGDKKAHVLPHMPEVRRKIVMEVAEVYRITTQLVDEEPRRSIQLIRRIDSRIPVPLLSQASVPTPSRLGSLGDLRKPAIVTKPTTPGGPVASAWRSGASGVSDPNLNVAPRRSSATVWARPNLGPVARTSVPPQTSRVATETLAQAVETREDIPANWEDE
ncbi:R3H domain [Rhizoctonia solani]|uniref:R3H domain n=1 Tax=Rhizoctonia solani TaxID=456999 RepID=A0A8H7IJC6_9AGAM|nr:R3H domain [Rhizoctonia solani]